MIKTKIFEGKNVVVGISGGIAAYKMTSFVSALVKLGANVRVLMTKNATKFIDPRPFWTATGNKVYVDMFDGEDNIDGSTVKHIEIAKKADIFIIAPATANIIGKIANGIADDMLTTTVMAAKCPVVIAPAMNENMLTNNVVRYNISKLMDLNFKVLTPVTGDLACGGTGEGRLPDTDDLLKRVATIMDPITAAKELENK